MEGLNVTLQHSHLPEKNCTISSLLQPKGRPRSRMSPSPAVPGQFGPVCFMTQSISTLLDLKTTFQEKEQQAIIESFQRSTCVPAGIRTLDVSVAHGLSVLLHSHFEVFLCLHLHKCLAAGAPLSCVSKVDTTAIVYNFATCIKRCGNALFNWGVGLKKKKKILHRWVI